MAETTVDTEVQAPPLPGTELLPDVKFEMVTYNEVDQTEKQRVDRLMREIDLSDSN